MKELLKNRVFLIVLTSDLMQQAAIWIRNIALLFFVMEVTGNNPIAVSLLTVAEYLPIFAFSFIGGVLADRWNPKRTMVAGDFLSALSVMVIVALMWNGLWQALFFATLVSAIVSQFSQPSSAVMFKKHVRPEQMEMAVGISQGLVSLFLIGGPVLGTMIYNWLGINLSLIVVSVIFLLSSLLLMLLPSVSKESSKKVSVLDDFKQGIRYVKQNRNLMVLSIAFLLVGLSEGIIQPLDVFLVIERLDLDKQAVQWLYAASGIGMLIGSGIAATLASRFQGRAVLFFSLTFLACSIMVEAYSIWLPLTLVMRLLVGVIMAFVQIVISTFIIKGIEEQYVGRVNGVFTPLLLGGILIGTGLSGTLVAEITLVPTFAIAALVMMLAAITCRWMTAPLPDVHSSAQKESAH